MRCPECSGPGLVEVSEYGSAEARYLCDSCSWMGTTPDRSMDDRPQTRGFNRYPRPGPSRAPIVSSVRGMLARAEAAEELLEPSPLEVHHARADLEKLERELREGR